MLRDQSVRILFVSGQLLLQLTPDQAEAWLKVLDHDAEQRILFLGYISPSIVVLL